jgi:hypothetical protein
MKRFNYFVILFALISATAFSQNVVEKTGVYQWQPLFQNSANDSMLAGLQSIRMVTVADLNNDGKNEIVATNYALGGSVEVFALAGQDTFELVWSSPRVDSLGGNSTPRNVVVGDLDQDGRKEIIFESSRNGIYIYEWDGNPGYNFGTHFSQLINPINCPGFPATSSAFYTEKMNIADIDNDGQDELVTSIRSSTSAEQKYMIIKASGSWDTGDPGFSGFDTLFNRARPNLTAYGLGTGSAFSMNVANLDGAGRSEMVLQAYDFVKTTVVRYENNEWLFPDSTADVPQRYVQLQTAGDGVSYFGCLVADVDKDGRDEVYSLSSLPDSISKGKVYGIYYDPSSSLNTFSAANIFTLDLSSVTTASMWGSGYGDLDGNGKQNLYFTTAAYGKAIVSAEFQGGDKTQQANWNISVAYKGDSTAHELIIRDSSGVVDTTVISDVCFPSKIFCNGTDVDGDGIEDLVAGYQQPWYYAGSTDSTLVTKTQWNSGTSSYDTISSQKQLNTNRPAIVLLSRSGVNGIQEKNLTFVTPEDYKLNQNYPNPFNPSTNINFVLPLNKNVTVKIYDMLGKEVATLLNNEPMVKGTHNLTWNGHDNFNKQVASGAYIFRMKAGNVEKSMKMMLIK